MKFILAIVALASLTACTTEVLRSDSEEKDLAKVYANMGLGYYRNGDFDQALEKLTRALDFDRREPDANHYIAQVYFGKKMYEKAEKHYRTALKYSRENPHLHNNYGIFLCDRDRYEEAETYFLKAAGNPKFGGKSLAYENVARCALKASQPQKAARLFKAALDLNPKLPVSLYNMAFIKHRQKEFLPARAYIQRFMAVSPPDAQVLMLGVKVETQLEDRKTVDEYIQRLRKDHGKNKQVIEFLNAFDQSNNG